MSIFDFAAGTDPQMAGAAAICSRKACREQASWQLQWNNPKIHSPERRKTWLACADHRDWLEDYLQTRGLWKETLPLADQDVSGALEQDS
jgi:hypothetical protein